MIRKQAFTVLVVLAAMALLAPAADARHSEVIFKLKDARGDDYGNGTLTYPINEDFHRGELDIVSFAARRVAGGTIFEATFARPIRVPQRQTIDNIGTTTQDVARLGFYNFNIDIYIDKDRVEGSGGMELLPGRQAGVRPDHAWDQAVIITPCPDQVGDALKRELRREVKQQVKDADREQKEIAAEYRLRIPDEVRRRVYLPNRVRVTGSKISAFVPDEFLGGPAQSDWSYVVAVSGADIQQSFKLVARMGLGDAREHLMVLPVGIGRSTTFFGGREEGESLYPALVDILVPGSESQEQLLDSYDSSRGRSATLVGIVPADEL